MARGPDGRDRALQALGSGASMVRGHGKVDIFFFLIPSTLTTGTTTMVRALNEMKMNEMEKGSGRGCNSTKGEWMCPRQSVIVYLAHTTLHLEIRFRVVFFYQRTPWLLKFPFVLAAPSPLGGPWHCLLQERGYFNIVAVRGGFNAWNTAFDPGSGSPLEEQRAGGGGRVLGPPFVF